MQPSPAGFNFAFMAPIKNFDRVFQPSLNQSMDEWQNRHMLDNGFDDSYHGSFFKPQSNLQKSAQVGKSKRKASPRNPLYNMDFDALQMSVIEEILQRFEPSEDAQ